MALLKVVAFVDGFNLYFGMRDRGWRRYYWLDVGKLAASLLRSNQQLVAVRYFTARLKGESSKRLRQKALLDAYEALQNCEIHYGQYRAQEKSCRYCKRTWTSSDEKMTDVNIAVSMLMGARAESYDLAMLISGDSDLVPAVREVRSSFGKDVFVAFPPERYSIDLAGAATSSMMIGRGKFEDSQMPDPVVGPVAIRRPSEWA